MRDRGLRMVIMSPCVLLLGGWDVVGVLLGSGKRRRVLF